MHKRTLLLAVLSSALSGCGFALRGQSSFAFDSFYAGFEPRSSLGAELKRTLAQGSNTRVVERAEDARIIMDVLADTREKVVLGTTAAGQTREFQLRMRLRYKLRTKEGREVVPDTEILISRDVSFNESSVLAKEGEEQLLYRSMQTDLVAQLVRRLAAVKAV
jgi:LPS-assembly lipoprotein